jgi:hypothetical protein
MYVCMYVYTAQRVRVTDVGGSYLICMYHTYVCVCIYDLYVCMYVCMYVYTAQRVRVTRCWWILFDMYVSYVCMCMYVCMYLMRQNIGDSM